MTRNFKALGPALVAAFAMTAVMASGAQAQSHVTVGASPAWLTGEQHSGNHRFSVENNGPVFECSIAKFDATVFNGDTEVTVVPTYSGCSAAIGAEVLPVTVTINDCEYIFNDGVKVTSSTFTSNLDLECPDGGVIEVHIYKNAAHTEQLCTLTFAPQTNKQGIEFHNVAGAGSDPNDLTLTTNLTLSVTRHGSLLCGKASNSFIYTGNTTIQAYEHKGGSISTSTVSGLAEGNQVSLTIS